MLAGDHVTDDAGTGFVHTAPSHGDDDYQLGLKHGLQMTGDDLPDYVPLFLEFLDQQTVQEAARLLGDAVHVLAHIGRKLAANGSPYAGIFTVLEQLSPVAAEALTEPPVRDMDEALETFGPGADGVEPLLKNTGVPGTHPINFYPKARVAAAAA